MAGLHTKENFINNKEDLNRFLEIERVRYGRKNVRIPLFAIGENQILWKHIALLRKTEYHNNAGNRMLFLFYRLRLRRLQIKYCLSIPRNVFDAGLKIMHLSPVLVNSDARVGKNCTLHMNTGIVAGGTNDCVPRLGDNIVLSMGSVVLGNVTLANGIVAGANAVVTKSFSEEDITIAGIPAKKVSDRGVSSWSKESREIENNEIKNRKNE